jgi:hypothetical protein
MIKYVLYVSKMTVDMPDRAKYICEILNTASVQNSRFGITGALIASQSMFAQVIEGASEPVDILMERIIQDSRHTEIKILRSIHIHRRRFADWAVAYDGLTPYVEKHLKAIFDAPAGQAHQAHVRQLEKLMIEFRKRLERTAAATRPIYPLKLH